MTTCLNAKLEEVRSAGKAFYVPSVVICGRTVVVTGKRIRMAQVKDEEVVEGVTVAAPETFIAKLKESELKADVFTFAQRPPEITPKYGYHLEWENWAVAPTTSFNEWWENRLPQETRKNESRSSSTGDLSMAIIAKVRLSSSSAETVSNRLSFPGITFH